MSLLIVLTVLGRRTLYWMLFCLYLLLWLTLLPSALNTNPKHYETEERGLRPHIFVSLRSS